MRRCVVIIGLSVVLGGGECGGTRCPPERELPGPMTEARASELAPEISTGFAASTTHIFGDCRPRPIDQQFARGDCTNIENPLCSDDRTAMDVWLVPTNVSLPLSDTCRPAGCTGTDCPTVFFAADVAAAAVGTARSSSEGEVVIGAEAGSYRVLVSADGMCARCGLEGDAGACVVPIPATRVVARDLVLDEATR